MPIIFARRALAAIVCAACSSALWAQAQLDPSARLLLASQSSQADVTRSAENEPMIQVFALLDDAMQTADHESQLTGATPGLQITNHDPRSGIATMRLPLSQLATLAQQPGIRYIQASHSASLQLDKARHDTHADAAQRLTDDLSSLPYTGHGVVLGWVDQGIDYMHNAFRSADGTLRIKRVWEQGTDEGALPGLKAPEGFGYGAEFTSPEIIFMAGADHANISHGTHVGGIAAGSDNWLDGQYRGIAPDAELVCVSFNDKTPNNVAISDAIRYIFDYADSVHKPCVINLSLGDHHGPHDGTSPFDQLADAMQGPGRLIVAASGNYGQDHFHLSRHFTSDASASDDPLTVSLEQPLQAILNFAPLISSLNTPKGSVELWADHEMPLTLEVMAYNTFTEAERVQATLVLPDDINDEVRTISLGNYASGTISISSEVNPINNKTHVNLSTSINSTRANYFIVLRVMAQGKGQVDLWADNTMVNFYALDRTGKPYEGFDYPTTESTITEIGGTAHRILTVGAYVTRDQFSFEGGGNDEHPVGQELNALFSQSGFGPTADGRQKPEVCAPGSFIISAVSGYDSSVQFIASHYNDANNHRHAYGYLQGTSMSSPFVAGAVALWLQAYPDMTPEQLKEVIAASSRQDSFTADTRRWGYGKVDVLQGLQHSLSLRSEQGIHHLASDDFGQTELYDLSGRLLRTAPSTDASSWTLPSLAEGLPHGTYILRVAQRTVKVQL